MEVDVQQVMEQAAKFDGKNTNDFLEWSSKLRATLLLYSKLIFRTAPAVI